MKNNIKLFNERDHRVGALLTKFSKTKKTKSKKRLYYLIFKCSEDFKKRLIRLYQDGYGYKIIAKNLGISYTVCRGLLGYLENNNELSLRKGMSIVTNKLREFRKEKALDESKGNYGFCSFEARKNLKTAKNSRGIQGYYFNSWLNKYVWLRSSWEYIYAKWLDSKNINWDVEVKYYFTDEGKYLPDFFIYGEDDKTIQYLVEIKGYSGWDRGRHLKLKENVKVVFINNIKEFILNESNEHREREEWKLKRKMAI
jgi:hypothetical protein